MAPWIRSRPALTRCSRQPAMRCSSKRGGRWRLARLVALIRPHAGDAGQALGWRPASAAEAMLRIHCFQLWWNRSDPAVEEELHDRPLYRYCAGLDGTHPCSTRRSSCLSGVCWKNAERHPGRWRPRTPHWPGKAPLSRRARGWTLPSLPRQGRPVTRNMSAIRHDVDCRCRSRRTSAYRTVLRSPVRVSWTLCTVREAMHPHAPDYRNGSIPLSQRHSSAQYRFKLIEIL